MKRVCIIGGGFAGITTAKHILKNSKDLEITLIDEEGVFTFIPVLPDIALGFEKEQDWTKNLKEIFNNPRIKVITDTVTNINFEKKQITRSNKTYDYNFIVTTTGATDNFFGTPGAKEFCLTLKSLEDANIIKQKISQAIDAYKQDRTKTDELTYVIIGGGPTGVELATAIAYKLDKENIPKRDRKISIINAAPTLLPVMSDKVKQKATKYVKDAQIDLHVDTKVVEVKEDRVITSNGKEIAGKTLFWAAGVQPKTPSITPEETLGKGHIMCEKTCKIKTSQNAFALGDCAAVPDDKLRFVPKVAQAAMKQGKFAAKNLYATTQNSQQTDFVYKSDGFMMSLGDNNAVIDANGPVFSGKLAAWLRKKAYMHKHKKLIKQI